MHKKLSISIIKEKMKKINPNIDIISDIYENNQTLLTVKCKIDGHEWTITWSNLRRGRSCRKCKDRERGVSLRLTLDIINQRLKTINPKIKILSKEYINANTPLECICINDNHIWKATWNNLSKKCGCPKCAKVYSHTFEEIKSLIYDVNNQIIVEEYKKYNRLEDKLKCTCLIDGHIWFSSAGALKRGHGCPKCQRRGLRYTSLSYIEKNRVEFENIDAIVYLIKCYNDEEEFYKIGVTKHTTKKRFPAKRDMPYSFSDVDIVSGNLYEMLKLELYLHEKYKLYFYTPKIKFDGCTECYIISDKIQLKQEESV